MTARSQSTRERVRAAWIFLSPMLLVLLVVAAWPLARTIWFGFTDASLSAIGDWRFIGLDNYLVRYDGEWYGLLADSDWWRAVYNTLWFAAVSVALEAVLGMIVALLLHHVLVGRAVVRAAVLIPWAIPTIVSAKMWSWMLNDQFGVINAVLMTLGLIDAPVAWTASPDTAMWAVVMVDVWKTTPFMALLLLAGLQMIPADCYEAARIDGVSAVRVFFRVTLPLLRPALVVAVVFRALDALRVFDLIYVITANSRDTMSMSVYARQQLVDFQEVGIGSAASTLLFMVIAVLTVITLTAGRVDLAGGRPR
jgi:trehalose/maltose transport system permease protein